MSLVDVLSPKEHWRDMSWIFGGRSWSAVSSSSNSSVERARISSEDEQVRKAGLNRPMSILSGDCPPYDHQGQLDEVRACHEDWNRRDRYRGYIQHLETTP